jgi:hypothetical protein
VQIRHASYRYQQRYRAVFGIFNDLAGSGCRPRGRKSGGRWRKLTGEAPSGQLPAASFQLPAFEEDLLPYRAGSWKLGAGSWFGSWELVSSTAAGLVRANACAEISRLFAVNTYNRSLVRGEGDFPRSFFALRATTIHRTTSIRHRRPIAVCSDWPRCGV